MVHVATLPFSFFAILLGLTLLVSPRKFFEIGTWVGRLMRLKTPEIQWKPGLHLDWRLVGGVLVLFGTLLAKVVLAQLLSPSALWIAPRLSLTHRQSPPDWYSLASALPMFLLGLFALLRARRLLAWMQKRTSIQLAGDTGQSFAVWLFRLVGVVFLLGAVVLVRVWWMSLW